MGNRLTIGFVPQYDVRFASSRYRVFQFFDRLQSHGFICIHVPAPVFSKAKRLVYLPKLFALARSCDVLYIQKRLFPTWILNLITKVNAYILYDFDDAIYLQHSRLDQFHQALRSARLVVAGNQYLSKYAQKFNQSVIEIPTVVNTDHYRPPQGQRHPGESRILIGWIGSDPNRGDLDLITDSLEKIAHSFPGKVALAIIAGKPYQHKANIPQIFIPWALNTYLPALQKIDIGIMPLEDSEWNRGKCAFKLIQYSAVEAATIASPVGMNTNVVLDATTGLLASSQDDWYDQLSLLIQNPDLRSILGQNGRQHIEKNYSVNTWLPRLIEAIDSVARE
jgi:glycosyltransferase involved in cell wall biosynthesis